MRSLYKLPLCAISRHRLGIDGKGTRTLLCVRGCPLRCRFCINRQMLDTENYRLFSMKQLAEQVSRDALYYRATGGGLTFGGGEPALYSRFITGFARKYCRDWSVALETSLNVPQRNIRMLLPVIDQFIVDLKSFDAKIYRDYTGKSPERMLRNLKLLEKRCPEKVVVRIPLIPGFNTEEECKRTGEIMRRKGFQVEIFTYAIVAGGVLQNN